MGRDLANRPANPIDRVRSIRRHASRGAPGVVESVELRIGRIVERQGQRRPLGLHDEGDRAGEHCDEASAMEEVRTQRAPGRSAVLFDWSILGRAAERNGKEYDVPPTGNGMSARRRAEAGRSPPDSTDPGPPPPVQAVGHSRTRPLLRPRDPRCTTPAPEDQGRASDRQLMSGGGVGIMRPTASTPALRPRGNRLPHRAR